MPNSYLGTQLPQSWMAPSPFLELLLLGTASYGMGHPFGWSRSAVLALSPPSFLSTLSLLDDGGQSGKKRKPWHCTSTAQPWPKYWCVTNIILVSQPKYIIIQAAMKKMNSTPARPSTAHQDRRGRAWRIQQRFVPPPPLSVCCLKK